MLKKEEIDVLLNNRFMKVYNVRPIEGRPYYSASRRSLEDLPVIKDTEEFKSMIPDAVSIVVVLEVKGQEPLLCLNKEFRFPVGQFLLSVPAGLIDPEDKKQDNPLFSAAKRELFEEMGIEFTDCDEISLVNPLLFSTPGMTDESNGIVKITIRRDEMPNFTQEGAEVTELFDGFTLVNKEQAKKILLDGVDEYGIFYSVYTWIGLVCFVSEIW